MFAVRSDHHWRRVVGRCFVQLRLERNIVGGVVIALMISVAEKHEDAASADDEHCEANEYLKNNSSKRMLNEINSPSLQRSDYCSVLCDRAICH